MEEGDGEGVCLRLSTFEVLSLLHLHVPCKKPSLDNFCGSESGEIC